MGVIPKPLPNNTLHGSIDEWYIDFIDVDDETVRDLILAANYLDAKSLMDLCCAHASIKLSGKDD